MLDTISPASAHERIDALERQNRLLKSAAKQAKRNRELWESAVEDLRATKLSLGESNAFLDRLIDATPLPTFALSRFGRIVRANEAAGALLGVPVVAATDRKLLSFLGDGSRRSVLAQLRRNGPRHDETRDTELTVRTGSGDEAIFALRWSTALGPDSRGHNVILILQDVTERRRTERALQLTQFSVDRAADPLFWVNGDGRFCYVNEAACRALGYSRDELLSMNVFDIDCEITERSWPNHWRTVKQRKILTFETSHRRRDGGIVPVEISTNYLRYGEQEYSCAFARDISERRKCEVERDDMNSKLIDFSRKVGMADVASGVLHNVGNVLNSLNVSLTLVCERVQGLRLAGLKQAADMMQAHNRDLGSFLTNDERGRQLPGYLAALSANLMDHQVELMCELESIGTHVDHIKKIVAAQQSYAGLSDVAQPTNVAGLVDDALTMNAGVRHDIEVTREYEELPTLVLVRHKLVQILVNLIRNAEQSVNQQALSRIDGGKRITARILRPEGGLLRFQIADNGVGIAAEDFDRLFEHGFTTKPAGHGFGLHTSAIFAKNLGGTLTAESKGQGLGATFTLDIPVS